MKLTPFRKYCADRKIHPATGYRHLQSGILKAKKLGRLTFVIEDDEALPDYVPLSQRKVTDKAA